MVDFDYPNLLIGGTLSKNYGTNIMTLEQKNDFINRIISITPDDKAKFGQMNVSQMICHCADQLRMAFGEIEGLKRQNVDLAKLQEMRTKGETLPTVDGLDQVAGDGTKPTNFENDKKILIDYLERYFSTDDNYKFSFHPYFDEMDKTRWDRLVVHHLNHHLGQFGR